MRIEYDNREDVLYLLLRKATPCDAVDIEEGVTVDLDAEGHIVGVEILDASERLGLKSLRTITVEDLHLKKPPRKASRIAKQGAQ